MPGSPDEVTWTPITDKVMSYEAAEFNGRRMAVWLEPGDGHWANVGGFPVPGSPFASAAEAKAAAVREAAS